MALERFVEAALTRIPDDGSAERMDMPNIPASDTGNSVPWLLQQARETRSLEFVAEVLSRAPRHEVALRTAGDLLMERDRFSEASALYERVDETTLGAGTVYPQILESHTKADRPGRAAFWGRRWISQHPWEAATDPRVHDLLESSGEKVSAEQFGQIVQDYIASEDFDRATVAAKLYTSQYPDHPAAWDVFADVEFFRFDDEAAAEPRRRAMHLRGEQTPSPESVDVPREKRRARLYGERTRRDAGAGLVDFVTALNNYKVAVASEQSLLGRAGRLIGHRMGRAAQALERAAGCIERAYVANPDNKAYQVWKQRIGERAESS